MNIRDELVKLQRDIEEHADDTCWCGPAETVVDRIEWMLQQYSADDQAPPSSNEFDNCLCGHRYDSHIDSDDIQGECGKNNCDCLAYRPAPEPQRPSNEQVTPVDGLIAESRAVLATHLNGTWKDDYAALRLAQMVRALLARIEETTALQRELQRARDTIDTFEMEANPRPAHEPSDARYEWLKQNISGAEWRRLCIWYSQPSEIDSLIDLRRAELTKLDLPEIVCTCHRDPDMCLVGNHSIEESPPPADDLYALLVRRGYAQHEAHAIAFGDKLAVLSSSPPPSAVLVNAFRAGAFYGCAEEFNPLDLQRDAEAYGSRHSPTKLASHE